MVKIIVFSVLTVLVVVAAAVTLRQPLDSSAATVAYSSAGSASAGHPSAFAAADSADLLQRVAQLEVRLEQEIATRQQLEQRLMAQISSTQDLVASVDIEASVAAAARQRARNDVLSSPLEGEDSEMVQTLRDAGFSDYDIDTIQATIESVRSNVEVARAEAEEAGERFDFRDVQAQLSEALQSELGASGYEQLLEATGQPTSVEVRGIQEASNASLAGIQAGDQIFSYNGERVFSVTDLQRLTAQYEGATNVVLEVERDGTLMTVSASGGTLGVETNGRRGR